MNMNFDLMAKQICGVKFSTIMRLRKIALERDMTVDEMLTKFEKLDPISGYEWQTFFSDLATMYLEMKHET